MKRFSTNTGAKFALFCLLVVMTFAAVLLLCQALLFAVQGCIPGQRYENSETYRNIMSDHILGAANLYRMEGEDLSDLSFVDQQRRTAERQALKDALSAEKNNFRFQIRTEDGQSVLYSNFPAGEDFGTLGVEPSYATVTSGQMNVDFPDDYRWYFNISEEYQLFFNDYAYTTNSAYRDYADYAVEPSPDWELSAWGYAIPPTNSEENYVLCYAVAPDYPVEDSLLAVYNWYQQMQGEFPVYLVFALFCAALVVALLVFSCRSAGLRRDREGVTLRLFDRVPFELLVIAVVVLASLLLIAFDGVAYANGSPSAGTVIYAVGGYLACVLSMAELLILTAAVRVRARVFWRHTLVGRLVGLCIVVFSHLELAWKFVLFYVAYELVSLWLFLPSNAPGVFFLLGILNFFVLLAACRWSVKFSAVRQGAAELAKGNLDYRINAARLPAQLRAHADDLNHISDGMAAAIEERTKSERLKSELITNVSHDIKTPLTSIINYVDLLKAEDIDNPKAREYIAVLDRQSARLKKLTNDLVDASKVSSGAMQVHLEDVDAGELLQQAIGEYTERFGEKGLESVLSLPQQPVYIRVDGALLWRVIDNLLSNICKYALPGTRVYIDAASDGARLTVSAKNVSRAALNIPPDELMERFVRGDSSRNSEGSGLGLSIARSLTALMGGTFGLEIDGDLFKARLSFPVIEKRG